LYPGSGFDSGSLMAHVTGQSRYQSTLFPEVLDEVVGATIRFGVIDALSRGWIWKDLGFRRPVAEEMGRPPYAPGDLLKLYIYGYLHRVRASRRLEAETRRNVQVMWLDQPPDALVQDDCGLPQGHAEAIVKVCRAFIGFCREQSLFGAELLAIDGPRSRRGEPQAGDDAEADRADERCDRPQDCGLSGFDG